MKPRMGATHFLTETIPKVAAEMALSVLAYNLKRVMNIVGTKPLIAAEDAKGMLETGAAGREEAFRGILAATRNAELRIYLVGKLRYLGIGDPDPLAYRLANRPDL